MDERQPLVSARSRGRGEDYGNNGNSGNSIPDLQYVTEKATQFNNEVTLLQRLADQVGTTRDSTQLRDQLHNKREECADIAKNTLQLMKKMKIERTEKVRHDKLVAQINDIFNRYQRITQNSIQNERVTPPPAVPQYQQQSNSRNNDKSSSFNPQPYRGEEEDQQQLRAQQQVKFQAYAVDRAIIEERDNELKGLEKDMQNLNEMFVDIAQMIKEQGEDIITIEDNTHNASSAVEDGVKELQKASEYQKSSRKKLCWLALILVILLAIVGGILALYFGVIKR